MKFKKNVKKNVPSFSWIFCFIKDRRPHLPQHQRVGVGHGVSQFEAQHGVLREGGVADCVGSLVRVQVGEDVVLRLVHLIRTRKLLQIETKNKFSF